MAILRAISKILGLKGPLLDRAGPIRPVSVS